MAEVSLQRWARAQREQAVRRARTDVNAFCEFVGRDEKTGEGILQAPMHIAWHDLLDRHDRTLIWSHVEGGKSSQLSILRTLYELGRDPSLRFLLLCNTKDTARKLARQIRNYIESSDELHDVFPDLLPGDPWGEYAFSVKRSTHAKDPSIQTSGVHGNILGSRIDRLVGDDILDWENTRTEDQRKNLIDWWQSTPVGRLTDDARVRVVGNAFHIQDLYHHLARQEGWEAVRYPVLENNIPRWPERWPMARIEKKAIELGPLEAARQLMCMSRDDASARFRREWIEVALRLGDGTELASALQVVPRGYRTFTGVDLAIQQHSAADSTVLFSIAVDPYGVRNLLSIESGKFPGPVIVDKIIEAHRRYQSIVVVENNAAQDYILQFARAKSAVPVVPFTTGRQKAHPEFGVESIAAELAGGKWKIPNRAGKVHPEVQKWIDEMLYYDPETHTGDRLMACWFAREGVRIGDRAPKTFTPGNLTRR